jgi:hypothetical protein
MKRARIVYGSFKPAVKPFNSVLKNSQLSWFRVNGTGETSMQRIALLLAAA